jgi:AraC-like DNA-binding protein
MSMTCSSRVNSGDLPYVECLKLEGARQAIDGLALVLLATGELSLEFFSSGECVRLIQGDLLVVPAGERVEAGGRASHAELLWLRLPTDWISSAFALAGRPQPSRVPEMVAIERAGSDRARRAARLLREICAELDPGRTPLRFVGAVLELLTLGMEAHSGFLRPVLARRRRTNTFLEVIASMRNEPLEDLSVAAVAKRLSVSERQVSRFFQEHLQMGFREWATVLRLERARSLLGETDRPIIEVAAETGWSSLAHFNSVFRRRVGSTPTLYRASRWG